MRQRGMADTATTTTAPASAPAPPAAEPPKKPGGRKASAALALKKVKVPKVKVAKKPSTHPKISLMVDDAIKGLNERGGSSFKAIKKYIMNKHKVDVEKLAPFMRRYLKSGVKNGTLIQAKGRGANGSFKLPHKGSMIPKVTEVKKVVKKVSTSPKSKKLAAAKVKKMKATSSGSSTLVKKAPVKVKKSVGKKVPASKKSSVKKASNVKVTKSPKPKKVVAKKLASPKKAPPKKK